MVDLVESIICVDCYRANDCKRKCISYSTEIEGVMKGINNWLNSFNTDSATVCFTAIQELKKVVGKNEETNN